ncbi:MAG: hypothetical protein ACP59X_03440 [Solidesulfovibrio sp. DCME]|uniref:hypothetical protein n=1 Tax=Solidesulfovibrio sp. DCME TaxID=3447380 RepID=UPI003D12B317
MFIYLAGFSTRELEEYVRCIPQARLNVLLSYGLKTSDYRNFLETNHKNINSVILDSGAFTANFSSNPENLKFTFAGYKTFCEQYSQSYDYAINYDLDFEKGEIWGNVDFLRQLKEAGVNVVPVVHDYSGDELELYLQNGYDIISLGYSKNEKTNANIKSQSETIYKAGHKVHALGVSSYDWLANTPIHFADSSSWSKYPAYGFLPFWNQTLPGNDKTHILKFDDIKSSKKSKHHYKTYAHKQDLVDYLQDRFGYKYIDLLSTKSIKRRIVSIDYYVQLQNAVTQNHLSLGFMTDR